jgi:hypothetical protein
MTQNKKELLIDQLDLAIQGGKPAEPGYLIGDNEDLRQFWSRLQLSVDLIREAGLRDRVSAVRKQFETGRTESVPSVAKVRTMNYRVALRVAASILILAGAGILYKYATTSPDELYRTQFSVYNLSAIRGESGSDEIDQAYRNGNWRQVIGMGDHMQVKSAKTFFLSGVAAMELKEFDVAILHFTQILQQNKASGDDYFGDEAEYYLALSYLASGNLSHALPLLDKIRSDKQHRFHKKACEISAIELKILSVKAGK